MRARKEGDNRPMPVLDEGWVDKGDTSPPDESMPLRNSHPCKYQYKGSELLEAAYKTLALSMDQHVAIRQLKPPAVLGNKTIEGGRGGGLHTAEIHETRRTKWEGILRTHYKDHPLTHHIFYRKEAAHLLRDRRVKWGDSRPKETYLRKEILPPLLRELFPHLCH